MHITRLAPSPTGALHLGNARTFLINWIMARKSGWRILLRIEDLDGPRIKPAADRELIDDLKFLGLDWDDGPVYQSSRVSHYHQAIQALLQSGAAYPCVCSRKEVELAASAPHAEDGAAIYPGTCRGKFTTIEQAKAESGRDPAIRFAAPDRNIEFEDRFAGKQTINVARRLGDFVIAKSDGTAAYQLAVVVDDLSAGITEIVRGNDLLESTPRQILIYEALGAAGAIPRYTHLPLVVGPDGRRLAKRHGDTRISMYRDLGVKRSRILSMMAKWCGIDDAEIPLSSSSGTADRRSPGEDRGGGSRDVENYPHPDPPPEYRRREELLIERFDLRKISLSPIVFTPADDAWLRQGNG